MTSLATSALEAKLLDSITSYSSPPPTILQQDVKKVPLLFYVCYTGSAPLFSALRNHSFPFCNIDVNALNSSSHSLKGCSPLWAALSMGHVPLAQQLLDVGADVTRMYDPAVAPSPLIIASQNGHLSSVDFILSYLKSRSPSPDFTTSFLALRLPTPDGANALFKASQNGHLPIVRSLCNAGANVNSVTLDDHATALSIACFCGHVSIVSELLSRPGVVIGRAKEGMILPPLHAASRGGHLPCLSLLLPRLKGGAAPLHVDDETDEGLTALHVACGSKHGDENVVRALLDAGADASIACAAAGLTPLMIAASKGYLGIAQLLVADSKNREAENKPSLLEQRSTDNDGGRTPLIFAVESSHHTVAELLLKSGAFVHAGITPSNPSSDAAAGPFTALHIAALNNDPAMVRLLLSHGADVERRSSWKRAGASGKVGVVSARAIANQMDFLECSKLLMEASRRTTPIDVNDKNVAVPDCFKEVAGAGQPPQKP